MAEPIIVKGQKQNAMGVKRKGAEKVRHVAADAEHFEQERLKKPSWIRAKMPTGPEVMRMKAMMREQKLHSVCEEASCPNLGECFRFGTASFMIMGDICTRRCPFCDVAHGRPRPLNPFEPRNLAQTVYNLGLAHVVITSVDRDDLRDGGAAHFAACIREIRRVSPKMTIEILTPDFRGRAELAVQILSATPPDVFNHNLETIPRFYDVVRPGANYERSLHLLRDYKKACPKKIITKSGLMVGLGEEIEEILQVMQDLRSHDVDMLTVGQYLQPSVHHLPVKRYYTPEEFDFLAQEGKKMGFLHVASGAMVRSSYHADRSAQTVL
ncbi:lipoyl synthase [Dichelobacter nodosus]|uniref:Lipoyl synthase n=1 Tax=Dichelobacter nodosus (strain VCS1703A) TaxID=246195 RepID=LIPA_DICNV|nr:lipoyl synthase [Dichelobacter nodosus]A5EVQ3.1 RecName: Full=Lipoyl synthase; AltName: Full=Lip-syn; Short=LS; AltName: Full=Lipoate synthase; AltName: Full=Lipoic acid synthase; AltName: Full=Sulfur insertion protein LipA [Dichelobacter nodosus VCS1703A]ABQ13223.1 lipoate synthase [Dichelobacter nodosus VCS1703A]AXM45364.1 lipoyl synthase [Dichelobacter nodosus]KNZ39385.1 lipoyl synthase [Dichelobacter nodosus]TGA65022.1 lipoyl synthase [Dichelobacter nodosus]